jgi:hypothetical protein
LEVVVAVELFSRLLGVFCVAGTCMTRERSAFPVTVILCGCPDAPFNLLYRGGRMFPHNGHDVFSSGKSIFLSTEVDRVFRAVFYSHVCLLFQSPNNYNIFFCRHQVSNFKSYYHIKACSPSVVTCPTAPKIYLNSLPLALKAYNGSKLPIVWKAGFYIFA